MALPSSPEKAPRLATHSEKNGKLVVMQPTKLMELNDLLVSLENLDRRVSEVTSEDRSGDWSSQGQGAGHQQTQVSARDLAIAAIPPTEAIQGQLETHIRGEVKKLEKLARQATSSTQPGGAYMMNEIYAKIRRLNALLAGILEASLELLRKLYIRVFIDHQPIL